MSIKIDEGLCRKCGKCISVCPGSLIYKDDNGKAYIKYPKRCWGCAACLKECSFGAIKYYLGADIGGKGAYMVTKKSNDVLTWTIVKPDSSKVNISINQRESNKY